MGRPLLLLEAANSYRGDLEDRLTEIFAVALDGHEGFCQAFAKACGVKARFDSVDVSTQVSFLGHRRLVDIVIDCKRTAEGPVAATLFVESKYNPLRLANPHWFSDDQWRRQRAASDSLQAAEKRVIGVASRYDLERRPTPPYDRLLSWEKVGELAIESGDGPNWRHIARHPTATAAERILLEFVTFLKGDTVGGLEDDDLLVLARADVAWERITALLERVAKQLDANWHGEARDDWITPGGTGILYVTFEPAIESWLTKREDGLAYVFIAGALWEDKSPVGDPTIYAGSGWNSTQDERAAITGSGWPAKAAEHGFEVLSDKYGSYVVQRRPLGDFVSASPSLSQQVEAISEWASPLVRRIGELPEPPLREPSHDGSAARARLRARGRRHNPPA